MKMGVCNGAWCTIGVALRTSDVMASMEPDFQRCSKTLTRLEMEPAEIDDILTSEDSEDLKLWLAETDRSINDGSSTVSALDAPERCVLCS